MTHPNQRVIGPWHWKRGSKSARDVAAENPVGTISATSSCPFVYKIIESKAVPQGGGMFEILLTVEPADLEESARFLKWDWSSKADREDQARWIASELQQKSWYSGVPANEKLFCEAHQKMMPAHGGDRYYNNLVCYRCVEQIEKAISQKKISDPPGWVRQSAHGFSLVNQIDYFERGG